MSNQNHDDVDVLAGEYVLGTLDESTHNDLSMRRQHDSSVDAAISGWEQRLAPLALTIKPVEPPAEVFSNIIRRLDQGVRSTDNVVQLQRQVQRWRRFAIGVTAVAASLLAYISFQSLRPAQPDQLVAVLQQSNTSPAFLVSVDIKSRELTIRSVAAPAQQDKSYELWIVNDKLGAPRSLGVVDTRGASIHRALVRYDSAVVRDAVYAISLEPQGGSPTGHATGPILYTGKLLELAN